MRRFTQFVLITTAIMATPSTFAEIKIAMLNYQTVLLELDAVKQHAMGAGKGSGPQLSKPKNPERDAEVLQDKLVSNGSKMLQDDREGVELDFKQKARNFRPQSKELNELKAAVNRDMLRRLKPKLDQAVKEVAKKGGYGMVIERGAVVDVRP